jgi:mannosyltransferase OCH1-like enzyme
MTPVFSKNIFQVWFQGCETVQDQRFQVNIKNWKMMNPDWNYHCLNDDDLFQYCSQYSERCARAYKKASTMHTKIDMGKMVALYLNGGLTVDMDMYILRPISYSDKIANIISTYEKSGKNFIAFSTFLANPVEKSIMTMLNNMEQPYNNALALANKYNPFIKAWIDNVIIQIENTPNNLTSFEYINNTTGPIVFNSFILQNKNNYNIIRLSPYIFEPCKLDKTCVINDETVAIHNYEASWIPPWAEFLINLYINPVVRIISFFCFVLLIYYVVQKFKK